MNEEFKNMLKKRWKGWGAVLAALVLIAVTPLLVCAVEVLVMGLRVDRGEWKMFACLSGIFAGGGFFIFPLIAAIRWLCCWVNLRRFLLSLALLATLLAIFYTEEDWRGRHAWKQHLREHAAKGEKLESSAFIPPAGLDDQNFCACPLLRPIMGVKMVNGQGIWSDTNGFDRVVALSPRLPPDYGPSAITNGLIGWQAYYRSLTNLAGLFLTNSPAEDVLRVLRRFEPELAELRREAERRPLDRWPIQYDTDSPWNILLPHLGRLKPICSLLQLRATAELASGDAASAVSDLQLGFRLANSTRGEPFLISQVVRGACCNVLLEPLREGLGRHQLSDAQLTALQRELLSADLLGGWHFAIRAERSFAGTWTKLGWKEVAELARSFGVRPAWPFHWFVRLAPQGWIYQDQVAICRYYDDWLLPFVDIASRTVTVRPASARAVIRPVTGPYSFLVLFVFQLEGRCCGDGYNGLPHVAYAQTQLDEALLACALERYHLAHGEYPQTLEALAPRFIEKVPHDLIKGGPLHYRLASDGNFRLYSVGWNGTDEGGVSAWNSDGQVDVEKGDWAWP